MPGPAVHGDRVRPQRARADQGRVLDASSTPTPRSRSSPRWRSRSRHRRGRAATWAARCASASTRPRSAPGSIAARGLRRRAEVERAAPPPLRGQQRLPRPARRGRPGVLRHSTPTSTWSSSSSCPRDVHPYYIGTQAHPELRSRPTRPHPLFAGLVGAAHLAPARDPPRDRRVRPAPRARRRRRVTAGDAVSELRDVPESWPVEKLGRPAPRRLGARPALRPGTTPGGPRRGGIPSPGGRAPRRGGRARRRRAGPGAVHPAVPAPGPGPAGRAAGRGDRPPGRGPGARSRSRELRGGGAPGRTVDPPALDLELAGLLGREDPLLPRRGTARRPTGATSCWSTRRPTSRRSGCPFAGLVDAVLSGAVADGPVVQAVLALQVRRDRAR